MPIISIGKADRNRTIQELMGEVPRTGNRYLDLATGDFVAIVTDEAAPAEGPSATTATPPEPEVKKKRGRKK